jgi:hypothetical protein
MEQHTQECDQQHHEADLDVHVSGSPHRFR